MKIFSKAIVRSLKGVTLVEVMIVSAMLSVISMATFSLLSKLGLSEPRLGAAGYSMFQQAAANVNDSGRQQNRRVEIFVLAPDAKIAGRTQSGVRR